uniref:Uncharacterized protein n=1 Tax=Leersia perrieri TaxID=77586 RepID=A0A0D9XY45_9ORYZ
MRRSNPREINVVILRPLALSHRAWSSLPRGDPTSDEAKLAVGRRYEAIQATAILSATRHVKKLLAKEGTIGQIWSDNGYFER